MSAVLRYQAALVLRSHRWVPPVLLYAVIMAIGVGGNEPLLGSFGWATAAIMPIAVWLTRVCVTVEPAAARQTTSAAVGPGRAHFAALLLALVLACVLAAVCTGALALSTDRIADHATHGVAKGEAVAAGAVAQLVTILAGVAIGALSNRPVLRRPAYSVALAALATLAVLITKGSPAAKVLELLTDAARHDAVDLPTTQLAIVAAVFVVAVAAACRVAAKVDHD
ncbi:ABC transporter [Embleya sp. NBC_00896]|uniref:ABC transporter n=1 Tax=Embleya sp. NBC_00896 TaxID=2975961 RepID=UPI003867842C|nr:ABC transporter [Embleya sp. NBC_00896]